MKVTDGMVELALQVFKAREGNANYQKFYGMQAALEAVFAIQRDVVKDFVDMMEDLEGCYSKGSAYDTHIKGIKGTAAFKALKSSISPVSEERFNCIFCGTKGCAVCGRSPGQPTDTQDNDGWIKHSGNKRPNTQMKLKAKCQDGSVWDERTYFIDWRQDLINPVIAYRIIDEPKEEKEEPKKRCDCWDAEIKEPKKQTLLEYALTLHDAKTLMELNGMALTAIYSEYWSKTNAYMEK